MKQKKYENNRPNYTESSFLQPRERERERRLALLESGRTWGVATDLTERPVGEHGGGGNAAHKWDRPGGSGPAPGNTQTALP